MSDRELIALRVGRLRQVRRGQVVLDYLMRAVFWGAAAGGLVILASRIFVIPWPELMEYYAAGAIVAGCLIGFAIAGCFVRVTPLRVANDIDVSLGLKERVSSALVLSKPEEGLLDQGDPFVRNLVSDAARTVDKLPLRRVYPWRIPRTWRLALPALLIAAGISFVPQLNLFASEQEREEYKLVQEQGHKLEELAKAIKEESKKKNDETLKEQATEIKRVGEKLSSGGANKKEALKEMQRLKDKLQTMSQSKVPAGQQALAKELLSELKKNDATRELGESLENSDLQGAQQQLGNLLKNLSEGKMTASDQQQLQELMKSVEQSLKSDAAQNPDAQKLTQQMKDLQQAMQKDQELRKAVEQALDSFEKDLNNLSQQLSQNGMQQQAQQLQQQMQQMQQQMQQNGMVSPQNMQQMMQSLQNTQQAIQNNQSLSQQQKQNMGQACQQAMNHLQGQPGQQDQQGQLSQQNQQAMQNRQQMGQSVSQSMSQCNGGG
jgi:hypothetical protein